MIFWKDEIKFYYFSIDYCLHSKDLKNLLFLLDYIRHPWFFTQLQIGGMYCNYFDFFFFLDPDVKFQICCKSLVCCWVCSLLIFIWNSDVNSTSLYSFVSWFHLACFFFFVWLVFLFVCFLNIIWNASKIFSLCF